MWMYPKSSINILIFFCYYFDSFKDISELDLDEINALVDDITTVDLQYGYSVETSNNDRAIISFGIRNIFNERTAQILN